MEKTEPVTKIAFVKFYGVYQLLQYFHLVHDLECGVHTIATNLPRVLQSHELHRMVDKRPSPPLLPKLFVRNVHQSSYQEYLSLLMRRHIQQKTTHKTSYYYLPKIELSPILSSSSRHNSSYRPPASH